MRWTDVRAAYPGQWLVIEVLEDHIEIVNSTPRRVLDRLAVIELCGDGCAAKHRYLELRHELPGRKLCFLHTSYPGLSFDGITCPELAEPVVREAPVLVA
jgi:hypothetical protein